MPLFEKLPQLPFRNRTLGDPHDWELPSSYSVAKSTDKQTIIPDRNIFRQTYIPSQSHTSSVDVIWQYPNVSHAATHLALLECFRNLRIGAVSLDVQDPCSSTCSDTQHSAACPDQQRIPGDHKWTTLLQLAVTRFAAWWSNIDRVLTHASAYGHHAGGNAAVQLGKNYLPPLDVLLVWYAFMLDSDSYREACRARESEVPKLRGLCFPWPAILEVIDMEKMEFVLPNSAQNLFLTLTGQSSNILTYLQQPPAYAEQDTQPIWADLVTQIKNHESFINEAHTLLWIRSPALSGSLTRSIKAYFQLDRDDPIHTHPLGTVSFGITLIRRTHCLFPQQYDYFLAPSRDFKRPIPQNDSPDATTVGLHDHLTYECYCWTCERIRDYVPDFVHSSVASTAITRDGSPASQNSPLSALSPAQLTEIRDDLGFYHAVEAARRKGSLLPTRPPTTAEKEAEKAAKERQDKAGYLPGLHEYVQVLPDGSRKIRKQKKAMPWYGLGWI